MGAIKEQITGRQEDRQALPVQQKPVPQAVQPPLPIDWCNHCLAEVEGVIADFVPAR